MSLSSRRSNSVSLQPISIICVFHNLEKTCAKTFIPALHANNQLSNPGPSAKPHEKEPTSFAPGRVEYDQRQLGLEQRFPKHVPYISLLSIPVPSHQAVHECWPSLWFVTSSDGYCTSHLQVQCVPCRAAAAAPEPQQPARPGWPGPQRPGRHLARWPGCPWPAPPPAACRQLPQTPLQPWAGPPAQPHSFRHHARWLHDPTDDPGVELAWGSSDRAWKSEQIFERAQPPCSLWNVFLRGLHSPDASISSSSA